MHEGWRSLPALASSSGLAVHAVRALIIARKKLVGQTVTLENQIRGLAVVFGIRLPRGLSPAFAEQVTNGSQDVAGLAMAIAGLLAARNAVLAAITAIDRDMKRLARASEGCRRVAAMDEPERFRRSRDVGDYLGLVPRRYQSGEIDYSGSISKCGDRRVRTLLYETANVMLTRYRGETALKSWALAIGRRSTMRKARIALARRLAIIMHAMLRHGTEFRAA
jgi:transposase